MDEITNGAAPMHGLEDDADLTWGHPGTLGLAAFALSILSLMGAAAFRGIAYTAALAPDHAVMGGPSGSDGYVVGGAFLSAAFALLPLVLARYALSRVVPSDGAWTGHLVRVAVVLSALSFVLHLVLAVLMMTSGSSNLYYNLG